MLALAATFAFALVFHGRLGARGASRSLEAGCSATGGAKQQLLDAIAEFDAVRARDGTVSIDFGVKGGELDEVACPLS